jgi:hypothetical protein
MVRLPTNSGSETNPVQINLFEYKATRNIQKEDPRNDGKKNYLEHGNVTDRVS